MSNLVANPNAVFALSLRRLLTTDFAVPETWNSTHQALLDNDGLLNSIVSAHTAAFSAHGATVAATPGRMVLRHATTGRAQVADGVDAADIATRGQVDAHAGIVGEAHGATVAATANRLMLRDAAGRAQVVDGLVAADIATRGQLDAHAALTNPHSATSAPTTGRLMLRDAAGRAQVAAPAVAADIARLDTVTAHTNRTDNPHVVTAAQIGAETPAGAQSRVDTHAAVSYTHLTLPTICSV